MLKENTHLSLVVIGLIVSLSLVNVASAENKTFIKEYIYMASDIDSKVSSRAIALEQVKRALLEQLGTYLISETEVKNYQMTKDQITTLTAGIVSAEIVEEKWDGRTYYLKAKIAADPKQVAKSINLLKTDLQKTKELEDSEKKAEAAMKELERLRRKLDLVKDDSNIQREYTSAINDLSATDWFDKGYAFQLLNDLKNAIHAYSNSIKLNPLSETHNNRGVAYKNLGNFQQAIDDYANAIKLDPNNVSPYNNRGNAYNELGKHQQAIDDFDKAIKLNPKDAKTYGNRGIVYCALKNFGQAIEDFDSAIKLNPNYAELYNSRGNAYCELGKCQQAIDDYDTAMKLNPKYAEAYGNRGNAYNALGKQQQAVNDYTKAIGLNPKYANAYSNRGAVYSALGKQQLALNDFNKAIELNPKDSGTMYNMACMYSLSANYADACKWLKISVEKGFNDWTHIKEDKDFDNIRDSLCYREIMQGK